MRAGCSSGDEMLRILADNVAPTQFLFGSDRGWPAPDEVGARLVAALQPTWGRCQAAGRQRYESSRAGQSDTSTHEQPPKQPA